jgi:hypothetical protein
VEVRMKILDSDGSSKVFSNAFDASSVSDLYGGKMMILYFPETGDKLSLFNISLTFSIPIVFIFSDSITLTSGCSNVDSCERLVIEANCNACSNTYFDEFESSKYA